MICRPDGRAWIVEQFQKGCRLPDYLKDVTEWAEGEVEDGKELEPESAERMLDKKMSKHADRFIHSVCDA